MNSPHESVKDIASDLWKNNRPFAIALLVVIAAGLFILYKRSQSSLVAPAAAPDAAAVGAGGGGGGNVISNSYTTITKTVLGQSVPVIVPQPMPKPVPQPVGTPLPPVPSPVQSFLIPHLAIWRANSNGTYSWRLPNTSTWNLINVPKGTAIYQGSSGRIWYLLPGQPKSAQQVLNP